MPTYQYACTECGHQFETVQSFTDDALTDCPQCTGRLRKVFNAVGIVFKGSGFYRTDSREKAGSKAGAADTAGATSDSKGETKPKADAAKTDSAPSTTSGGSAGAKESKPAAKSSSSTAGSAA